MRRTYQIFFDSMVILSFLLMVFSFFYSGTFLTDDEHLLSARSLSFAFDDQSNFSRVAGNNRVFEYSLLPTNWADEAANIEPAQAFFAAFLARLSILLGTGRVQTMFLLNIWVTAGTAIVLFITAIRMRFSRKTGYILAIFFALGTMVFPYTKTFFRDPLAMFFLSIAWFFSICIKQGLTSSSGRKHTVFIWIGFLTSCVAGIFSKNSIALAIPVLLFDILLTAIGSKKPFKEKISWKKIGLSFVFLIAFGLFWFLVVPRIPMLARYDPGYYFSILKRFISTAHPDFFRALVGPFISPGKSIFFFSPILIIVFWSLVYRFRTSWPAWLYLVLLILSQALFYNSEWSGHVNWGWRVVLPALPPLILTSSELIEKSLQNRKIRIFLWTLFGISLLVQLLGSIIPVREYFVEKFTSSPPVFEVDMDWQIKQSILLWSAKYMLSNNILDLAVYRNPTFLWVLICGFFLLSGINLVCLKVKKSPWLSIISIAIAVGVMTGMLFGFKKDARYQMDRVDFVQAQDALLRSYQKGDLVYIKSYTDPLWNYWMNWGSAKVSWTALPYVYPSPFQIASYKDSNEPEAGLDLITLSLFTQEINPGNRVWFLSSSDSMGAEFGFETEWLSAHARKSVCQDFGEREHTTKLCFFEIEL